MSPKVHDEILKLEDERDIVIRTGGKTGHTQESVIIFPLIFLSLGFYDSRIITRNVYRSVTK